MNATLSPASIVAHVSGGQRSLPPADDRLYEPVAFGPGWLVAGVVAVVFALGLLAWALWRPRAPSIAATPRRIVDLRNRYLRHLGDLEKQLTDDRITPRALHHELSRTLRRFATEAGTIGATAMSAAALERAGLGPVAAAVRNFEHPQFEELPEGDPRAALRIATAVVSSVDVGTSAPDGGRA